MRYVADIYLKILRKLLSNLLYPSVYHFVYHFFDTYCIVYKKYGTYFDTYCNMYHFFDTRGDVSKCASSQFISPKSQHPECVLQSQIPNKYDSGRAFLTQDCVRKQLNTVDNNFLWRLFWNVFLLIWEGRIVKKCYM